MIRYPTTGVAIRRENVRILGMFQICSWRGLSSLRVDFRVVASLAEVEAGGGCWDVVSYEFRQGNLVSSVEN